MTDWSPENPFGAVTPYELTVEGKWKLSAVVPGLLAEHVTCPLCGQQRGLHFATDSARLGYLVDITCPTSGRRPHTFQVPEITGYDLRDRLSYLQGDLDSLDEDLAETWATDPDAWTGPVTADAALT